MDRTFEVTENVTIDYLYEVNKETGLVFNVNDGKIFCEIPEEN